LKSPHASGWQDGNVKSLNSQISNWNNGNKNGVNIEQMLAREDGQFKTLSDKIFWFQNIIMPFNNFSPQKWLTHMTYHDLNLMILEESSGYSIYYIMLDGNGITLKWQQFLKFPTKNLSFFLNCQVMNLVALWIHNCHNEFHLRILLNKKNSNVKSHCCFNQRYFCFFSQMF
jgi:hypothetical protein